MNKLLLPALLTGVLVMGARSQNPPVRIVDILRDGPGDRIAFQSDQDNHYYVLRRGDTLAAIGNPVDLKVAPRGTNILQAVESSAATGFYKVERIPVSAPVDSDGDGADDLLELNFQPYRSPLTAADAAIIPPVFFDAVPDLTTNGTGTVTGRAWPGTVLTRELGSAVVTGAVSQTSGEFTFLAVPLGDGSLVFNAVYSSGGSNFVGSATLSNLQAGGLEVPLLLAPSAPAGMALIPAGVFQMGDAFTEGYPEERPVHPVYVDAFFMDKYEVSKALWDEVRTWALANGYTFSNTGQGKAANHPVHSVNWYDCVKWRNARSEKEGLTPAYYTDAARTFVYRTGEINLAEVNVNWTGGGFRLPTEAEWEKAARGGLAGQRFPWGANIMHTLANYYSDFGIGYDTSPTHGYHPTYGTGATPYTSPVGTFAANGYGLFDMAGNQWELNWDWYDLNYYASSPATNPHGAATGSFRVLRGGSWDSEAFNGRCAGRANSGPTLQSSNHGFRCAR